MNSTGEIAGGVERLAAAVRGLTVWGKPDGELFHSQYGYVTYREWCAMEIERLKAVGIRAVVVTDQKSGLICIVKAQ